MKHSLAAIFVLMSSAPAMAEITYEGSSTIGLSIMPEAREAFARKTGVRFSSIMTQGSGKGFKAAIEGKALVAGVSRTLTLEEQAHDPYYQIIGYDALTVFVHPKNPVKTLTKRQVKEIFAGRIKNWKDLGGRDLAIVCVTQADSEQQGTTTSFKEVVMDGASLRADRVKMHEPSDMVSRVEQEEAGITFASLRFSRPAVRSMTIDDIAATAENVRSGAYALSRPLLLVTRGLPSGELALFMSFMLSAEGQRIVAREFVPAVASR
jgi:phosphate transport system substrate-binding protein